MNWVILALIIGVQNGGAAVQMNNAFSKQFESQTECNEYVKVRNIILTTSLYDALKTIDAEMDWTVKGFMCIPKAMYDELPKIIKDNMMAPSKDEQEQEGIKV